MRSRGLIPALPRRAWEILAFDAISALGSGMVLPFLIIYLHRVRGFEIEIAGLALGTLAAVGLVAGPLAGSFVDRVGARKTLMAALGISSVGALAIVGVREPWHAFVATGIVGAGEAAFWPSIQSLLATVVDDKQRSNVFSVHYATINAGLGFGGIFGGLIASIDSPTSFEVLYLIDACTFLPLLVVLARRRQIGATVVGDSEEPVAVSYLTVFKDRVFLRLWLLMAILAAIGYGQVDSAFPAFATGEGGVSTRSVGIAFATNTFLVVAAQFVALKRIRGKRRTRALVVLCGMWAVCWMLVFSSAGLSPVLATVGFSAALGFFALGETLLSPTIAAIVNDIAPERLRGRYNAVYSLAWSMGHVVGPPTAALFLGAGWGRPYFLGLVAACGLAALYTMSLERHLPAEANLTPADPPR